MENKARGGTEMAFPDTGPREDGTRSAAQWMAAMGEDVGLVNHHLRESMEEGADSDAVLSCALARKEATRLLSDIRRFAKEVHGLSEGDLDKVGPSVMEQRTYTVYVNPTTGEELQHWEDGAVEKQAVLLADTEYRVVTEVWRQTQPATGPRQFDTIVRQETLRTEREARRLAERCSPPKFKSATVQARKVGPWEDIDDA